MKKIIHHISLRSIGGMQDAFISFYNKLNDKEKSKIEIYGNYPLEKKNFTQLKIIFILD